MMKSLIGHGSDVTAADSRRGRIPNFHWPICSQSVYTRIAGYEDVNDAERLAQDPTFRLIGSGKTWDRGAALTCRFPTFETEMLAEEENFGSLARINPRTHRQGRGHRCATANSSGYGLDRGFSVRSAGE